MSGEIIPSFQLTKSSQAILAKSWVHLFLSFVLFSFVFFIVVAGLSQILVNYNVSRESYSNTATKTGACVYKWSSVGYFEFVTITELFPECSNSLIDIILECSLGTRPSVSFPLSLSLQYCHGHFLTFFPHEELPVRLVSKALGIHDSF